jgi:hypothetical protein
MSLSAPVSLMSRPAWGIAYFGDPLVLFLSALWRQSYQIPSAAANAAIVLKTARMTVDCRIDLAARNLNSLMTWNVELLLDAWRSPLEFVVVDMFIA